MKKIQDVTLKTESPDGRTVTLWVNEDKSVSLLGNLPDGTQLVINQELVNNLQKIVNQFEAVESLRNNGMTVKDAIDNTSSAYLLVILRKS